MTKVSVTNLIRDKSYSADMSKIRYALKNVGMWSDKWIKFIYELQESQITKEHEHYDKFAIRTHPAIAREPLLLFYGGFTRPLLGNL